MTPDEKLRVVNTNLDSDDYELVKGLSRVRARFKQKGDEDSYRAVITLLAVYSSGNDFTDLDKENAKSLINKANEK